MDGKVLNSLLCWRTLKFVVTFFHDLLYIGYSQLQTQNLIDSVSVVCPCKKPSISKTCYFRKLLWPEQRKLSESAMSRFATMKITCRAGLFRHLDKRDVLQLSRAYISFQVYVSFVATVFHNLSRRLPCFVAQQSEFFLTHILSWEKFAYIWTGKGFIFWK